MCNLQQGLQDTLLGHSFRLFPFASPLAFQHTSLLKICLFYAFCVLLTPSALGISFIPFTEITELQNIKAWKKTFKDNLVLFSSLIL